jgi:hypothetical protein
MQRLHIGPLIVLVVLACVELASARQLWLLDGSTAFVHYEAAMLFLGPWNLLASADAVTGAGLVPLLSIFLAPIPVAVGIGSTVYAAHRKWGASAAGLVVGLFAVTHIVTGLWWGLMNTSWGP